MEIFTLIQAATTAVRIPASTTFTQIAALMIGATAVTQAIAVIGVIVVTGVIAATSGVIPIATGDLIDLKWAKIDGEWVIYQSELDEWVKINGKPHCPVCKSAKGVKNARKEGNIKRGECANCGARLAIIK